MSGYRFHCRICHEVSNVEEHPNVPVCDNCVRPLAVHLCKEGLGVELTALGVDQAYWVAQARFLMAMALKRWVPIATRDLTRLKEQRHEVERLGGTLDRT